MPGPSSPNAASIAEFAALVRHHMDTGTRPTDKRGSGAWSVDAMVAILGKSRRTVDYYRSGESLPPDALPLADAFFGDDPRHTVKRHAFLLAFARATGTQPPPWAAAITNVPIREPAHFLGRDDTLSSLQAAFASKAGRVAITALHGLRGVGKTTLAAAYAERHRSDYRAIWWIRAGTEAGLRADLVGLGVRLDWIDADLDEERALATVLDRLRDEGDGVLLIYDNALDARQLAPHLPRGGAARILVTSNAPDWRGVAEPVEIAVWPPEVGADYLTSRTSRKMERTAAEALSVALGGLPLAHEQAAAYCEYLDISLAEYHGRFVARTITMLGDPRYAPADYHDGRTVAATFTLAIEAAAARHPAAEPLLAHLALLAPEPIPLFLLREGYTQFADPLDAQLDGDGLDEAMAALRSLALLRRETIPDERVPTVTTETVHVHRLVREIAAARLTIDATEAIRCGLVSALYKVFPAGTYREPEAWPRTRRLEGLVMALLDAEADFPESIALAVGQLLTFVASYRQAALGAYAQARSLSERALAILETALGPDHPGTATGLNNLALLHMQQGRLDEAAPLFKRAVVISEKALGLDHPNTATVLNNLAVLYKKQGRLDEAAPLYTRALVATEKTLGSDHPDTATSLSNLALLYKKLERLDEALPLHIRALSIRMVALGPDHPDTATSLNNLASLYHDLGQMDKAAPLYKRALAIRKKSLGCDHPDTATSLNNLGTLYQSQGRLKRSTLLVACALSINEKVFGHDHPHLDPSLTNLAGLYWAQGRQDEAVVLYKRVLAIRENASG